MRSNVLRLAMAIGALWTLTAAGVAPAQQTPQEKAPRTGVPGQLLPPPPDPADARPIPFKEALKPDDPPKSPVPPPRPLSPPVMQALDVLYDRPSPMGPRPVARKPAAGIYVIGRGPIVAARPGPTVFANKVPRELAVAGGPESMFSNNMVVFPRGDVRFVSFDRTVNDTKMSQDSMEFAASFTDEEGNDWRIVQFRLATLSPDPVMDPWYGGVAIDTTEHGQTMRGHPAQPEALCAMCSWGWADVWKNGAKVASSALLHVMVTNDVRDDANGFRYACYDCKKQPMREIHVVIMPEANLPTPGGFLHVMWENSEITRGSPDEIGKKAAGQFTTFPTVQLDAMLGLRWSRTELEVPPGQRVRLVLNNMDPASFHAFKIHSPEGDVLIPLPQGSQWVTTLAFDQPGEYEFWCPVSEHREKGMYGRVVVGEGVPGGTEGPPGGGS